MSGLDPSQKNNLRDVMIVVSLLGLFGNVVYTASKVETNAKANAEYHEIRITKLEVRTDRIDDTMHAMDKKLDRLLVKSDAKP